MTTRFAGVTSLILLFLGACGGGGSGTSGVTGTSTSANGGTTASTHGTTAGPAGSSSSGGATGAATTGGSTGGATGTTSGGNTSGGSLVSGAPCNGDNQCASGVCGTDGSGKCCAAACSTDDATCGATACDASGACSYPAGSTACGTDSCSGSQLTARACDGAGTCAAQNPGACSGNLTCQDASSCKTSCSAAGDCVSSFYCNAGACDPVVAAGACGSNAACTSGVCGTTGTGNCCAAACVATADPACDASDCDATTGACVYAAGAFCSGACTGSTLTAGACDATGACGVPSTLACPGNLVCNAAGTGCLATCAQLSDCMSGFYCNAGTCAQIEDTGACAANDACTSGICGIAGSGHCCLATCSTADPDCGATDCDDTGACSFPSTSTTCGTGALSCTGTTQTNLPACDGAGTCLAATTTDCTPFICGVTACLATCTDATSCVSGAFCDNDTSNGACCSGLVSGGTLAVDSTNGNDSTACCGFGSAGPCSTLTHAMALIDAAQATGVTINATVNGGGGDWGAEPAYPVVLGWRVELSAPGVYFLDAKQVGDSAVLEISAVSANDTVGSASLVGGATSAVGVGMNAANTLQTSASAAIEVEAGNTLFLANATVNGSATNGSTAILVQASGSLTLGQDESANSTGTVTIGNALGQAATDGWIGLFCDTDSISAGCTITDAALIGVSSVVIQGQEDVDLVAADFSSVTLSSAPVIGVPPSQTGFGNCPSKTDAISANRGAAVIASGPSTLSMSNATLQCIGGLGIVAQADDNLFLAGPTVTIDGATIQNTDLALGAVGGTITVTNSTLEFNFNGSEQIDDSDGLGSGDIDLSGGGNVVACSSNVESSQASVTPGIGVYNGATIQEKADNVAWNTPGPDYLDCNNTLANCTCNNTVCVVKAGNDGMDAVEDSTNLGGITTTSHTLAKIPCN
jgi:hypothetical protein